MSMKPNVLCRAASASWNKASSSSSSSLLFSSLRPSCSNAVGATVYLTQRFYSSSNHQNQDTPSSSSPVRGSHVTLRRRNFGNSNNNSISINRPFVRGHSKQSSDRRSSSSGRRRRGRGGGGDHHHPRRNDDSDVDDDNNDDYDSRNKNTQQSTALLYYQETRVKAIDPFEIQWLAEVWTTPSRNVDHPAVQIAAKQLSLHVDQWKMSSATLEALPLDQQEEYGQNKDHQDRTNNKETPIVSETAEEILPSHTSDYSVSIDTTILDQDTSQESMSIPSNNEKEIEPQIHHAETTSISDNGSNSAAMIQIQQEEEEIQSPRQPSGDETITVRDNQKVVLTATTAPSIDTTTTMMMDEPITMIKPRPGGEINAAALDYYSNTEKTMSLLLENERELQTPYSLDDDVEEASEMTTKKESMPSSSREVDLEQQESEKQESGTGNLKDLKATKASNDEVENFKAELHNNQTPEISNGTKDQRQQERSTKQESKQVARIGEATIVDSNKRGEKDKATVDNKAKGVPWWASRRLRAKSEALQE